MGRTDRDESEESERLIMRWLRFERCIPIQYGSSYDSFESLRERKEKRERAGERAARGASTADRLIGYSADFSHSLDPL